MLLLLNYFIGQTYSNKTIVTNSKMCKASKQISIEFMLFI